MSYPDNPDLYVIGGDTNPWPGDLPRVSTFADDEDYPDRYYDHRYGPAEPARPAISPVPSLAEDASLFAAFCRGRLGDPADWPALSSYRSVALCVLARRDLGAAGAE